MIALDLFAGTGWGVACQRLGIEEYGVEIMPEARATRAANGMTTLYNDVWEGLNRTVEGAVTRGLTRYYVNGNQKRAAVRRADKPAPTVHFGHALNAVEWRNRPDWYDLLIASPPCQTFSMAGGGAGRKALDDVLGLIDAKAYRDVATLRVFGESHDPRTALVLTPLAHVYRDLPRYVVFEQVPPVLPVWERCAEEMRAWGYSVWTGNLQAEMYGVPQTRKRAILIAKRDPDLDGEAAPPVPTHSRYYSRDPQRLDEGVLPWVSMAEALDWEPGAKAAHTRRSRQFSAGGRPDRLDDTPAPTVTGHDGHPRGGFEFVMRSNDGTGGDPANRGERVADEPPATITSKADRNQWHLDPQKPATTVAGDPRLSSRDHHEHGAQNGRATRVTVDEAATLQSYPPGFEFAGTKTKQFLQVGNAVPPLLAEAILRAVTS